MIVSLMALLVQFCMPAAAAAQAPASRPVDDARLQLMTFNIRYGLANDGPNNWKHRRELVFEVLSKHGPDVVGIQEAIRFQLDEILAAVPDYEALGCGRDDGKSAGEYSPILYRKNRFKVLEQGNFWLSETPEVPGSKSWNTACTRVCTWARFEDRQSGRTFYFFNTHLDHISQEAREKGISLIVQRIRDREHPDPMFLTGDFNAGEDNEAIRIVRDSGLGLRDSFRVAHPDEKTAGTFHGWKGKTDGNKIDYVFVPKSAEVRSADIVRDHREDRYPTDHFPVSAEVTWKQGPAR